MVGVVATDLALDPGMLKFDFDLGRAHESSKEKIFSQRTEKEQNAVLICFIQNPRVFPGCAKLGHMGKSFCPWQGTTTVMRKGKSRGNIREGCIRDEVLPP